MLHWTARRLRAGTAALRSGPMVSRARAPARAARCAAQAASTAETGRQVADRGTERVSAVWTPGRELLPKRALGELQPDHVAGAGATRWFRRDARGGRGFALRRGHTQLGRAAPAASV